MFHSVWVDKKNTMIPRESNTEGSVLYQSFGQNIYSMGILESRVKITGTGAECLNSSWVVLPEFNFSIS